MIKLIKLIFPYKVKLIHYDYGIHRPIIRYYKFRSLKKAKKFCEYATKYNNCICEIL